MKSCHNDINKGAASKLEENIREARIEVEAVLKSMEVHKEAVENFYEDGKNKTMCNLLIINLILS